jgi:hypothetical protein
LIEIFTLRHLSLSHSCDGNIADFAHKKDKKEKKRRREKEEKEKSETIEIHEEVAAVVANEDKQKSKSKRDIIDKKTFNAEGKKEEIAEKNGEIIVAVLVIE